MSFLTNNLAHMPAPGAHLTGGWRPRPVSFALYACHELPERERRASFTIAPARPHGQALARRLRHASGGECLAERLDQEARA
jgi:hypothetical protein